MGGGKGGWGRDGGREDVSLGRFLPIKGVKFRRGELDSFCIVLDRGKRVRIFEFFLQKSKFILTHEKIQNWDY